MDYKTSILGLVGYVIKDSRPEEETNVNYPHVLVDFGGAVGQLWLDPDTEVLQGILVMLLH